MDFTLLIVGADANAYYMARCYHELTNKKAYLIAQNPIWITDESNITIMKYNKELHEFSFMNLTDTEINWYIEHAKQAPSVDLTPVVLCLYESGLDVIQPYKIPMKESKEIVDIYVLSIGSAIKDEPNVLTETPIFVLPTNLRAARIAKLMYFESGIDITYPKPIIQRIYHGPINEADESKLNEFINKSFTYNPIDNPAILFENAPAWISLFNN